MDFSFILDSYYLLILLRGFTVTIVLALLAVLLGSIFAIIPTLLRYSKVKILKWLRTSYVELIRGTPLLVQVLLVYSFFRLPVINFLGIDLASFIPGMIALLINSSAYVSEIMRGGINSVDKGQKEGALSLGMNKYQTAIHVIIPQAVKNSLPSLGNEFISIIKETSIFMYLGVAELMYSAQIVRASTFLIKEVYIVTALMYFILTFTTSKLIKLLEKRLNLTKKVLSL